MQQKELQKDVPISVLSILRREDGFERGAVTYTGGRNFTTKEDDIKYWVGWLKEKHE